MSICQSVNLSMCRFEMDVSTNDGAHIPIIYVYIYIYVMLCTYTYTCLFMGSICITYRYEQQQTWMWPGFLCRDAWMMLISYGVWMEANLESEATLYMGLTRILGGWYVWMMVVLWIYPTESGNSSWFNQHQVGVFRWRAAGYRSF